MLDLSERVAPKFSWSEITCGEACWSAKDHVCKCSCGGKNHGIWLHGGHAERTHKHNGHMYKLIAVDKEENIRQLQEEKLDDYGIYRCYDYYGNGEYKHQTYKDYYSCRGDKDIRDFPVVAKKPTLEQIERWHELKDYKGITKLDWYRLDVLLLWELIDKPEPVKHECGEVYQAIKPQKESTN